MTDLLDAVDALTKPIVEHMAVKDDDGKWIKAHSVEHPPLLIQLKNAVHPSSNTAAGSASLASTRNLIDSDALYEYAKMTAAIGDWCHIIKSDRTRDPIIDLRRWYIVFTQADNDPTFYINQMRRWATKIRKLLNPPNVTITIEAPCPVCGKTEWGDIINGGGRHPIQVECWVDPDTGTASGHSALCRACRLVWHGYDAVTELAEEITEKKETA